jgi:hypothetical protein
MTWGNRACPPTLKGTLRISAARQAPQVCLVALLILSAMAARSDDLPVSAQADILKRQIAEAIKSNRDKDALAALDQYHLLEKKGEKIPPLVLFIEAQLAERAHDSLREYDALTAFLKFARSSDPHYQDAITMYSQLSQSPNVKAALAARQTAQRRRQAEAALAAAEARERHTCSEGAGLEMLLLEDFTPRQSATVGGRIAFVGQKYEKDDAVAFAAANATTWQLPPGKDANAAPSAGVGLLARGSVRVGLWLVVDAQDSAKYKAYVFGPEPKPAKPDWRSVPNSATPLGSLSTSPPPEFSVAVNAVDKDVTVTVGGLTGHVHVENFTPISSEIECHNGTFTFTKVRVTHAN